MPGRVDVPVRTKGRPMVPTECPARRRRQRTFHPLVLAAALFAWCLPTLAAGQVAGTISGYVKDPDGAVMPGATVTVSIPAQKFSRTGVTNESGFFDFLALPRGTYEVTVEMSSFETLVQKGVELSAGANVRLDFALKIGGITEQVVVGTAAPMIETRTATQSSLVDDRRVQDLPM